MKGYIIRDKEGKYYIGHCGKFGDDVTKARIFKSPKTAIRHYYSEDDKYEDLEVVQITIELSEGLKITDELYETYNNYDYQVWKRKNNK